ncbi:trimethylamine methyltransferase family protein [Geosporobacter ferrireducens]|uniref:trimethylamine methyltransferase family protein n=1 Tax=Geosporobacter ferrireducens TaxID=1424294 RepID=UPI001471ED63|nr:trimethylamine methyltransferase family protein [Geosporobacter ferrireducens]
MVNEKIEVLHRASIDILSQIGIEFQHEETKKILLDAGIEVKNNRAYFTEEQINEYMSKAPKEFIVYARDEAFNMRLNTEELNFTPGYGCPKIMEVDGKIRNALFDDYLKFAELVHVSPAFKINGGILVQPNDIDAKLSAAAMVYTTMKRSSKCIMGVSGNQESTEHIMHLASILFGGREELKKKPRIITLISTLSPLKIDRNALETLYVCTQYNQPIAIAPGPMAGGTGPISPAGNIAMANAEILGTLVLTQILNPGNPVIYTFAATTMDMRTCNVSIGSPGFTLQAKYGARLAKKYGLPCRSGGGMTDANGITAQSGFESMMSLFEAYQEKANFVMHSAGILDSFSSMSYEKFVMDLEIIDRLKYYFKELEVNETTLALDAIKDVVEGTTFIEHIHTVQRCRKDPWFPSISIRRRLMPGEDPNQVLYDSMHNRLEEMLRAYKKPEIDGSIEKQLDDYMLHLGMNKEIIGKI